MTGSCSVEGRLLGMGKPAATRMQCADSQENAFTDMLSQVSAFLFMPEGEPVLEPTFDPGVMMLE